MIERIDEIIDINLKILFEQNNQNIPLSQLRDVDNHLVNKILAEQIANHMGENGLIDYDDVSCYLTKEGLNIINEGGWLKHLELQKSQYETQRKLIELEEEKNKEIANISQQKLLNDKKLSDWQVKTFWPLFIFAFFGSIAGIIALILQIIDKL